LQRTAPINCANACPKKIFLAKKNEVIAVCGGYTVRSTIDGAKRFEVLTAVLQKNKVFCKVALCFFG
jgi:hypothetical protein